MTTSPGLRRSGNSSGPDSARRDAGRPATKADRSGPLLTVSGLRVSFAQGWRRPRHVAVDDVSFYIEAARTVGLVGESGSGKSTIGNAILGLVPPEAGSIRFDGEDITRANARDRRRLSAHIQVVFQDPYGSFNPARSVGQTVAEPMLAAGQVSKPEVRRAVAEMLERVGLRPAAASRYPASFSGGQRQRIAIARALITKPEIVVCDEAVSALDLSTQAQILNLLIELQQQFGLALLFISHDLAVVRYMAHDLVVLNRGKIVEKGPSEQIYQRPSHPYTQRLVDAAPIPDPKRRLAALPDVEAPVEQ